MGRLGQRMKRRWSGFQSGNLIITTRNNKVEYQTCVDSFQSESFPTHLLSYYNPHVTASISATASVSNEKVPLENKDSNNVGF